MLIKRKEAHKMFNMVKCQNLVAKSDLVYILRHSYLNITISLHKQKQKIEKIHE